MNRQNVMSFLNEVANQFPDAISLAAGRPKPDFFYPQKWGEYQRVFVEHLAQTEAISTEQAWVRICEYSASQGIINDILAKHLSVDEDIEAQVSDLIVTNGFQEAMALYCLDRLKHENDVILTFDPAYIGLSALVESINRKVIGIGFNEICVDGQFDWSVLQEKVAELKQQGLNPVGIYVNPDYNNPLAYHLDVDARKGLLKACAACELDVVEDSPYGRFEYSGNDRMPSLRALDSEKRVYYIGSFAKTFCPGVRVGFLLVPTGDSISAGAFKSLKSVISVNTSGMTQAVLGGFLLSQNYTLAHHLEPVIAQYGRQRDALENALNEHLAALPEIKISVPQGGYFATLELPFEVNADDVFNCVKDYGVIFMPVSFFCLDPKPWLKTIRLSFSYYDEDQLAYGVSQLAQWLKQAVGDRG